MKSTAFLTVLFIVTQVLILSCGDTGAPGADDQSVLMIASDEVAGENCANGGIRVDTGFDDNGSGELEEEEIQNTKFICDGTDGAKGDQGEPGADGKDGADGTDGAKGDQGEPGADGKDGADGADGAKGDQGEPGADGKDGADGADGACAGNNAPVIESIIVNSFEYADAPIVVQDSAEIEIEAVDADLDELDYAVTGGSAVIVQDDTDKNKFTLTFSESGVFNFNAVVSDGCQLTLKSFAVDVSIIGESRVAGCTGLPDNAQWNSATVINQTWDGSEWVPSAAGVYNKEASSAECRFLCADGYVWDDTCCVDSPLFKGTEQWGTTVSDYVNSVVVDIFGNIFVTGSTYGDFDGENQGYTDVFLTKFNSDGTQVWTKQWGTTGFDYGDSVAVNSFGNVFVAGYTHGDLDGMNAGHTDVFLAKFNSDGTQVWTEQWGSAGDDLGVSVAVDSFGSIFVTGRTDGDLDGANAGEFDIFLTKFNSDGTQAWIKQWGTEYYDFARSVAVDSNGNIFVTGNTGGSLEGSASVGDHDIFLTKWNPDGTKAWTKQWGSIGADVGNSVAADSSGSIFVTGRTDGDLDGSNAGITDIILTKFNSDGTQAWTKQWGSIGEDVGYSVTADSAGSIFVTGRTDGDLDGMNAGGNDVILTKFNSDGTQAWIKQWGSTNYDIGYSVAVDRSGNIFVAGGTSGDLDGTNAGEADVFLTRYIY